MKDSKIFKESLDRKNKIKSNRKAKKLNLRCKENLKIFTQRKQKKNNKENTSVNIS